MRSRLLPMMALFLAMPARADDPLPPVSERARKVHDAGFVFDGHNDLPWRLRQDGDVTFTTLDIGKRLDSGQTDIPRAGRGASRPSSGRSTSRAISPTPRGPSPSRSTSSTGWSSAIPDRPGDRPDGRRRRADRQGGEDRLADRDRGGRGDRGRPGAAPGLRRARRPVHDAHPQRHLTLGRRRHRRAEDRRPLPLRRAGRPGDEPARDARGHLPRLAPATMADALRVSKAPIIASHSSAFALCPHPRNVPDAILKELPTNGGVVMVNFYSAFILPAAMEHAKVADRGPQGASGEVPRRRRVPQGPRRLAEGAPDAARDRLHRRRPHRPHRQGRRDRPRRHRLRLRRHHRLARPAWRTSRCYPRITEELLKRGYSEPDIHKILGGNALRALRRAGEVATELQKTTRPEVDQPKGVPRD